MTIMADDSFTLSNSNVSIRDTNDETLNINPPQNAPYVLFYCRANNGETIEERQIYLDKQCKIGRSVAKVKPESNNAIFDCKVLSRNHALLWYEANKFYLQDTKSSNGTYLNGQRLGKSNEDSAPFELNSGDIIQFGVDVTENTKKVTHGCITVEVKLFYPSGVEAKNTQNQQQNKVDIQAQELYQLALYIQEANIREQALQQKITNLQNFIHHAQELSENGWLALIDEDRLLSRIDFLEKQLAVYSSKNTSEDTLRQTINQLKDEKYEIEKEAKLSIQKLIEEKTELIEKVDQLKTILTSIEDESEKLRIAYESTKRELVDLATKHQETLNEVNDLSQHLNETKQRLNEKIEQVEQEKLSYEKQIAFNSEQEKILNAKIESLLAENDFQKQQLEGILNRSNKLKSEASESESIPQEESNFVKNSNYLSLNDDNLELSKLSNVETGPIDDNEDKTEIDLLKLKLIKYQETIDNLSNENELIKKQLEFIHDYQNNINQLEEDNQKLTKTLDKNLALFKELENQCKILKDENESIKKLEKNENISVFEENKKIKLLEEQIQALKNEINEKDSKIIQFERNLIQNSNESLGLNQEVKVDSATNLLNDSTSDYHSFKTECCVLKSQIETIEDDMKKVRQENNDLNEDYTQLQQSYKQLQKLKERLETKESQMQLNLTDAQKEADQYKLELSQALNRIKELEDDYEANLNEDNENMNLNLDSLNLRTRIVSYISMIPLGILLLATLIALYPYLATITATTN